MILPINLCRIGISITIRSLILIINSKIKTNINKDSIKIFWNPGIIKVNRIKVATVDDDGKMQLEGAAVDIKEEVEEFMKNWCEARGLKG